MIDSGKTHEKSGCHLCPYEDYIYWRDR
jgi:hypothetical protein